MSDVIREEGIWWPPGAPEQLSVGTLVIADNNAQLESVIGPLSAVEINNEVFQSGPPVLHGRSHRGTNYTCFRNYYAGFNQSVTPTGGHTIAKLDVFQVFKGQHIASEAEASFREATFLYSNLHLWLHELDPFVIQTIPEQARALIVRHGRGPLWKAGIEGGFTLTNDFSFNNTRSINPASLTVSHTDGIRLTSEVVHSYSDFLMIEHRFRTLVNLIADCQLELTTETFRYEPDGSLEAQLVGRSSGGSFARRQDPNRHRLPVPFSSLQNFAAVLTAWFTEFARLEPIVNLYLFGKQNRHLDIGNMFLGIMQALEAYHRTYHPGAFMTQADWDKDVRPVLDEAIPPQVKDSFRQRVKSAIQYAFEFSLRRRLKELADALPDSDLFSQVRNSEFRNRTVDTRNIMTHQIPNPEFPPMEDGNLYTAIQRWREALFALILGRIGVPNTEIVEAVRRIRQSEGTFVAL